MIRRVRGALGIAVIWALAWFLVGIPLALYVAATPPQPSDLFHRPVSVPAFLIPWTVWGSVSGIGFATILTIAERRRTLARLSLLRLTSWGALGAMGAPLLLAAFETLRHSWTSAPYPWGALVAILLISAGLGAACAAASLLLAHRAAGISGDTAA